MLPPSNPTTPTGTPAPVIIPPAVTSGDPDRIEFGSVASLAPLESTTIWGVPFSRVTLTESLQRIEQLIQRRAACYLITANLNYVMLHHQSADLRPVTEQAELILADGQPIVWRSRFGSKCLPGRVAGSELIFYLAELSSRRGWGIYFLGGEPGVAQRCADRLCELYPGMNVAGVESPPFRPLSQAEQQQQHDRIRRSGADILLVAFGQPKGERWIHQHYKQLGVPVSIQLGASFDFIAGTARRAPKVFQRVGAEWVYRMFSDPKRLVPRYWSNAIFLARAVVSECTNKSPSESSQR